MEFKYKLIWKYRNGILLYSYYVMDYYGKCPIVLPTKGYLLVDEKTLEAQVCELCNKDRVGGSRYHISDTRINMTSGKTGAFYADKVIDNIRKNLKNMIIPESRKLRV